MFLTWFKIRTRFRLDYIRIWAFPLPSDEFHLGRWYLL